MLVNRAGNQCVQFITHQISNSLIQGELCQFASFRGWFAQGNIDIVIPTIDEIDPIVFRFFTWVLYRDRYVG